jgi:hypothetical protein
VAILYHIMLPKLTAMLCGAHCTCHLLLHTQAQAAHPAGTQDPGHQRPTSGWELVQLPLHLIRRVLQQLGPRSLACAAVTCSTLSSAARQAAPAVSSKVTVHCSTPETLGSFTNWLGSHNQNMTQLVQCSIDGCEQTSNPVLSSLPLGPQLRQLRLQAFKGLNLGCS